MTDQQNALENLLDQIGNLLKVIKESEDKPLSSPLPEGIEKVISQMEQQVALLADVQQKLFIQSGITDEEISAMIRAGAGDRGSSRDQYFFDRMKALDKDARAINAALAMTLRMKDKQIGKKDQKQLIQERKKKFKRVGGDKGWIPL
jgi:hypothetical protein